MLPSTSVGTLKPMNVVIHKDSPRGRFTRPRSVPYRLHHVLEHLLVLHLLLEDHVRESLNHGVELVCPRHRTYAWRTRFERCIATMQSRGRVRRALSKAKRCVYP